MTKKSLCVIVRNIDNLTSFLLKEVKQLCSFAVCNTSNKFILLLLIVKRSYNTDYIAKFNMSSIF